MATGSMIGLPLASRRIPMLLRKVKNSLSISLSKPRRRARSYIAATGTNKVFDGTVNDVVSLASLGILSGDIVNFADTSATFANNKVGAGKVVTVKGITASGVDALNYRLGNTTATTTASITPLAGLHSSFQRKENPPALAGGVILKHC